ncbi:hypothetical protein SK128_008339, partial [Halocaridina rubra]
MLQKQDKQKFTTVPESSTAQVVENLPQSPTGRAALLPQHLLEDKRKIFWEFE